MPKKLVVDVTAGTEELVDLTDDEIAEIAAGAEAAKTQREAEEAAATKAATDAAAGKAKLKELGLTDDQIAALVG
jgi:hypothetical protein|tara:strand:+ start:310 stop:534 length:225 start_codon:yes stop_codon:yes gene_type:complete